LTAKTAYENLARARSESGRRGRKLRAKPRWKKPQRRRGAIIKAGGGYFRARASPGPHPGAQAREQNFGEAMTKMVMERADRHHVRKLVRGIALVAIVKGEALTKSRNFSADRGGCLGSTEPRTKSRGTRHLACADRICVREDEAATCGLFNWQQSIRYSSEIQVRGSFIATNRIRKAAIVGRAPGLIGQGVQIHR